MDPKKIYIYNNAQGNGLYGIALDRKLKNLIVCGSYQFKHFEINVNREDDYCLVKRQDLHTRLFKQQGVQSQINMRDTLHAVFNPNNDEMFAVSSAICPYFAVLKYDQGQFKIHNTYRGPGQQSKVNKLSWHPENENLILSGSQDYWINLWDISSEQNNQTVVKTWQCQEAVNDLKFNPHDTNFFIVALNNGYLEYFSIESGKIDAIHAHNSIVLSLDWSKHHANFFVSAGEKEIKIHRIVNSNKITEVYKFNHWANVGLVYWKSSIPTEICVSSIIKQHSSLQIYDISNGAKLKYYYHGHVESITSIAFSQPDEKYLVTGGKDTYIMLRRSDLYYENIKPSSMHPTIFTPQNQLFFNIEQSRIKLSKQARVRKSSRNFEIIESLAKMNFPSMSKITSDPAQMFSPKDLYDDEFQIDFLYDGRENNLKNGRKIIIIKNVKNVLNLMDSQNLDLKDEIIFLFKNYKKVEEGNYEEISEINAKNAEGLNKHKVAKTWRQFCQLFKQKVQNDDQFSEQGNNSILKNPQNQLLKNPSSNSNNEKEQVQVDQIEDIINYFEQYPQKFEEYVSNHQIQYKNNTLYIKKNFIKDNIENFLKELGNVKAKEADSLVEDENQENIDRKDKLSEQFIQKSYQDVLQDLVNSGELQSALMIYDFNKQFLNYFDKEVLEMWTIDFLNLLAQLKLYYIMTDLTRILNVENLRNAQQKRSAVIQACLLCTKKQIGNEGERQDSSQCAVCKKQLKCGLCQLPVRGLFFWCQICGHGGHMKEISDWFRNNQECPTGCGHKCFLKSKPKLC